MRQTHRRLLTGIFALAMVPLLAASAAFACQRLVTLHANPSSTAAGTQVQVQGTNYSRDASASNVDIRLDRRNGPVLASIAPASLEAVSASTGKFSVSVTIPAGTAIGNHMLIATQTLAGGEPCVGCPGRANLEVVAASAASASGGAAASASDSSSPAASSDPAAASEPSAGSAPATSESATESQATAVDPAVTDTSSSPATEAARPAAATAVARPAAVAPAAPAPAAAAPSAPATATEAAPPAEAATPAAAYESGPAAPAPVSLLPASSGERPSPVPGLALAAGVALVLLSLGAFWKSGHMVLGGRGLTAAS